MDFRSRSSQSGQVSGAPAASASTPPTHSGAFNNNQFAKLKRSRKPLLLASVVLLFSLAALVIALTFFFVFHGNIEQGAVQKDKYQAVFLNNGQVYFGSIKSFDDKIVDLQNIYYLQTSGTSADASTPSNVSLVKLGCELHAPSDRMLINKDQVIFWENITNESQVVQAIDKYKKENNGKLNCSQASQNSTQQAPATSSSTTTPATTSTTTTTKKP